MKKQFTVHEIKNRYVRRAALLVYFFCFVPLVTLWELSLHCYTMWSEDFIPQFLRVWRRSSREEEEAMTLVTQQFLDDVLQKYAESNASAETDFFALPSSTVKKDLEN